MLAQTLTPLLSPLVSAAAAVCANILLARLCTKQLACCKHIPACRHTKQPVVGAIDIPMTERRSAPFLLHGGCRYLLPPIIFYAGISVKKKQFFRNFGSIASFGVLGTYIAFAVIACVLYVFSKLPNILNFSVSIFLSLTLVRFGLLLL